MVNVISRKVLSTFLEQAPELRRFEEENRERIALDPNKQPPFQYLVRAIIYQQLSGKAAETIHSRFLDLVGDVNPTNVLSFGTDQLRTAGLSRQKAGYVRNVAEAFLDDLSAYESAETFDALGDQEIIELLTGIKGVGQWTVEMYLIFGLGRMDVLSATDLGVRKGLQIMYGTEKLPTPAEAESMASHWSPYSTVGTILCWRVQD